MLALLAGAARAARAVSADVVYLTVGTALQAPGDARTLTRRVLTAVAGDRAACGVLGCEHGPAVTVGGHRVRSCARCGLTHWETAAPAAPDAPSSAAHQEAA